MIKRNEIKYTYKDVTISPSKVSTIEHRSDCNPFYKNGKLPIFTAPMSTVVDDTNFDFFETNKINAILPRHISFDKRMEFVLNEKWVAFSLNEFEKYFCDKLSDFECCKELKVLIDVANGHMKKLYDLVKISKSIFGDRIKIMIGNIANPQTYHLAVESKVDYIRCGIGSGGGCITTSNTGVHFPMGSLIAEIAEIKESYINSGMRTRENITKIIADGGIRNYNDVTKAIALGADYVMIGRLFASKIGSCGKITAYSITDDKECEININTLVTNDYNIWTNEKGEKFFLQKSFYGMASVNGQKDLYGKKIKTSEGKVTSICIDGCLDKWCENMTDYIRSAMSYTNSKNLIDFQKAEVIIITHNASCAFNS